MENAMPLTFLEFLEILEELEGVSLEEREKWNASTGRDYSKEKKYQSSPERRKYRAKLNAYNRKRGTYGNGDSLDASHDKNGKISGFESESENRGRAEKSRLKGSTRKKD